MLISYIAKSLNIVIIYNFKTKQGQYRPFTSDADPFRYVKSDWVKLNDHSRSRNKINSTLIFLN